MPKKKWYYAKYRSHYAARWSTEKNEGIEFMRASSDDEAVEKFDDFFKKWVEEVKGYRGWRFVTVIYTVNRVRRGDGDKGCPHIEHAIEEKNDTI